MEELLLSVIECAWSDVRQTEMRRAEPLVSNPSPFQVQTAIAFALY
jgi:hypothetical protein